MTLECRKNLLDCATALTAALAKARSSASNDHSLSGGADQVVSQVVFPLLSKGCMQVEQHFMSSLAFDTSLPMETLRFCLAIAPRSSFKGVKFIPNVRFYPLPKIMGRTDGL